MEVFFLSTLLNLIKHFNLQTSRTNSLFNLNFKLNHMGTDPK